MISFLLSLYGNKNNPPEIDGNAEKSASIISQFTFSWISPLLRRGIYLPIQIGDIPPVRSEFQSSNGGNAFYNIYRTISFIDLEAKHGSDSEWVKCLLRHLKMKIPNSNRLVHSFVKFFSVFDLGLSKTSRSVIALTAKSMTLGALIKQLWIISAIAQALSIGQIIKGLSKIEQSSSSSTSRWIYFPFALIIGISSLTMSVSHHGMFYYSTSSAAQARAALSSQIYQKLLRVSPAAFSSMTSDGLLGNLLVTDLQRVVDAFNYFHASWSNPIELIILFCVLCFYLGLSSIISFTVFLVLIPFQIFLSKMVSKNRSGISAVADIRVQRMNEILSGIRLIKYSAWENCFRDSIKSLRGAETKKLNLTAIVRGMNSALFVTVPLLVSTFAFTSYTIIFKKRLSSDASFTAISIFALTTKLLSLIPVGWLSCSEVQVAFNRLDKFFDLPELPSIPTSNRMDIFNMMICSPNVLSVLKKDLKEELMGSDSGDQNSVTEIESSENLVSSMNVNARVCLVNAYFSRVFDKNQKKSGDKKTSDYRDNVLSNICLTARDGEVVCLIGSVGSGKSSLLHGILGELQTKSGSVKTDGGIAYCCQEPWILSGTIRYNIVLFGKKFDDSDFDLTWYNKVIECCCLRPDLQEFQSGDLTEVDKITISGGQKARIALARAIYSNSDIVLLDDPLAAVDASVSARLIENMFGPFGLLHKKLCIIATHNIRMLPFSSQIISLEDGELKFSGTYNDFKQNNMLNHLQFELKGEKSLKNEEETSSADITNNEEIRKTTTFNIHSMNQQSNGVNSSIIGKDEYCISMGNKSSLNSDDETYLNESVSGRLVEEEDRNIGSISRMAFLQYLKSFGGVGVLSFMLLLFSLTQTAKQIAQIWIGKWTTHFPENIEINQGEFLSKNIQYSYILFSLSVGTLALTLVRSGILAILAVISSRRLHERLLERVLHAKMYFFDTNPPGRILNRFSKDIDNIDMPLPIALQDVLQAAALTLGSLVTVCIAIPWLLIAMVPVVMSFLVLQTVYKRSSRELKRLDGISFSPIYSEFVQSFNGLSTIRAFKSEAVFSSTFDDLVDRNQAAYWCFQIAGRWLGFRLDVITGFIIFCTATVALAVAGNVDVGLTGIALAECVIMTNTFQWGVRQAAELENLFTSVERVVRMAEETPMEGPYDSVQGMQGERNNLDIASKVCNDDDDVWPNDSIIKFDNVFMKYRENLPFVLNGVSFVTRSRERIGIVGRTGSGKSSIFSCLFRITEISNGSILIDGKDISTMGLKQLREAMTIVPQDPVQFNGTIRYNLDPMGTKSDPEIWDAIDRVSMKEKIENLSKTGSLENFNDGLDMTVLQKGGNFSAGEQQLLSLARAILTESKIVVLDEASSSIDNHTDSLIQKTIRDQFHNRTVLTIAHRLRTIMDSDRILVVDCGKVVEFDTPRHLLSANGAFTKMVMNTGINESGFLTSLAYNNEQ